LVKAFNYIIFSKKEREGVNILADILILTKLVLHAELIAVLFLLIARDFSVVGVTRVKSCTIQQEATVMDAHESSFRNYISVPRPVEIDLQFGIIEEYVGHFL